MEVEVPTEPSPSEETPKSLHVVCSPGGGAFSVYMFLRYTLAQLSDPHISDVKMTMLCREEKGESINAEEWWNLWSQDEKLSEKLGVPDGWKPEFVRKKIASNSLRKRTSDFYIFILAGGNQPRIITRFWELQTDGCEVMLLTEDELVSLSQGSFVFTSAINNDSRIELSESDALSTQEAMNAINIVLSDPFIPTLLKHHNDNRQLAEIKFSKEIYFAEGDVTRLFLKLTPTLDVKKKESLSMKEAIKRYMRYYSIELRSIKKSIKFDFYDSNGSQIGNENYLERVSDGQKLLSKNGINKRGKYFTKDALFITHSGHDGKSEDNSLSILSWDRKNEGRSTELLFLMLNSLQPNHSILLVEFSPTKSECSMFLKSELIASLDPKSPKNIFNEDFKSVKVKAVNVEKDLRQTLAELPRLIITNVGMNGPSLKTLLSCLTTTVASNETLHLVDKPNLVEMFGNKSVETLGHAFACGVYSHGIDKSQIPVTHKESQQPWLNRYEQIEYLTWMSTPLPEFVHKKTKPFPPNVICTLDKYGKVLHTFRWDHKDVLELVFYISLFKLSKAMPENYSLIPPPILKKMWAEKSNFKENDLSHVGWKAPSLINPELFYTYKDKRNVRLNVADAKAKNGSGLAMINFGFLKSKYVRNSIFGDLSIRMLTFYSDKSLNSEIRHAHIYDWDPQGRESRPNYGKMVYSFRLKELSEYFHKFETEGEFNLSFESFSKKSTGSEFGFDFNIPTYQSKGRGPEFGQTSVYIFRQRKGLRALENIYSGLFFNPHAENYDSSYYFHNKTIVELGHYALCALKIREKVTLCVSTCGQYLIIRKPKNLGFRRRNNIRRSASTPIANKTMMHNSLRKKSKQKIRKFVRNRGLRRKPPFRLSKAKFEQKRRLRFKNQYQFNQRNSVRITELTEAENHDEFSKKLRSILTKSENRKVSSLTEEESDNLVSLLKITKYLGLDCSYPNLGEVENLPNLQTLTKWAYEVFFRLYSTADTNIMKKSKTLTAVNINDEVNSLFVRASNLANNDGAKPTKNFREFISQLNFFCREVELEAKKRYERYLELKAKRTSQSFQSDE
jgi:hypothetical protein